MIFVRKKGGSHEYTPKKGRETRGGVRFGITKSSSFPKGLPRPSNKTGLFLLTLILTFLIAAAFAQAQQLTIPEIKKLGGRLGELSPTQQNFTPEDNASFVDAMRAWNAHKWSEAVVKFQEHLNRFPNSPWAAEAELHLGCYWRYNNSLVASKAHFRNIIARYPNTELAQKAKMRYAGVQFLQFNLKGAKETFRELLKETSDWKRATYSRAWIARLTRLTSVRKLGSRCGPKSLERCFKLAGMEKEADSISKSSPAKPDEGYSLYDLVELSKKHGRKAWAVGLDIDGLKNVKFPAIAHLRSGHFVSIISLKDEILKLADPCDGPLSYSLSDFNEVWSGALLTFEATKQSKLAVRTGPLNGDALKELSAEEAKSIIGGCCGNPMLTSCLGACCEGAVFDNIEICGGCIGTCEKPTGCDGTDPKTGKPTCTAPPDPDDPPKIMPGFPDPRDPSKTPPSTQPRSGINMSNLNVTFHTTPIYYVTARGPDPKVALSYSGDSTQSGSFGNKWTFNYESYYSVLPNNDVMIVGSDGREDIYTNNGDDTYTPPTGINDTLVKNPDGSFTLTIRKDKTKYHYETTTQNLASVEDRHGNTLTITRDANGYLSSMTDAVGRVTTFTVDGNGRVTQVTLPDNRRAAFSYDVDGNLIQMTDMGGYSTSFTYDQDGYMTSVTKGQITLTYSYEGSRGDLGNPYTITTTNALGSSDVYQWEDTSQSHYIARENGTLAYAIDSQERVIQYDADVGGITIEKRNYQYDANNNVTSVSLDGNDWSYNYDTNNDLTSVTDPLGGTVSYTYDAQDNVTSVTDAIGNIAQYSYDGDGNLIQISDPQAGVTTYAYTANGEVASMTDRRGNTTSYSYDANGNLITVTDPLGDQTVYSYDSVDRLISLTDAANNTTSYTLDDLDRKTLITYPDSSTKQQFYDCCGLTKVIDPNANATEYFYDAAGDVIKVRDALGNETNYTYWRPGLRTSATDPKGNATQYQYDILRRLTKTIYADGSEETVAYDTRGNRVQEVNANGVKTKYYYDAKERLIKKVVNAQN